jgi:hypothetical protein
MNSNQSNMQNNILEDEPFSFNQLFNNIKLYLLEILFYWKGLVLFMLIGGMIGFGWAYYTPVTYTARTTFIVEEAKSSNSSLLSSITSQGGFDFGSMSGGSGMLSGDNVLQLLKSNSLVKKALLSQYDDTKTLADQYAELYGLKSQWLKSPSMNSEINFKGPLTRFKDSLLQIMMFKIIDKNIIISKPDKRISIFELLITNRDEKFSYVFSNNLLKQATDFYIDVKVGGLKRNVERLEMRADSLSELLDKKTYMAAEASAQMLNINKVYSGVAASAEISNRNKSLQNNIYASLVQNLEASKTALVQQTPVFQTLDIPEYPLKKNKTSKMLYFIFGALVSVFLFSFIIAFKPRRIVH